MTEQAISPLRRRMIEDMSIRKFAAKTRHDYVQRVMTPGQRGGEGPASLTVRGVRETPSLGRQQH
jgi:hypothetical protein